MGLFSKTKTKIEKIDETTTQSKIVKLSYLESIAISQGLVTAESITETEESTNKITDSKTLKNTNLSSKTQNLAGIILQSPLIGGVYNALFGKKVTQNVNLDVTDSGWLLQKMWNEPQFDVIRYAVGIRELSLSSFKYVVSSELVSTPWSSPKPIYKVSLTVNQYIPPRLPPNNTYIKYYIKPEVGDVPWIQINPLNLPTVYMDKKIVPRIITFNGEKNINSSLEEFNYSVKELPTSIRLRVVFSRPTDFPQAEAYTPVLKSYRLMMLPQGGLS